MPERACYRRIAMRRITPLLPPTALVVVAIGAVADGVGRCLPAVLVAALSLLALAAAYVAVGRRQGGTRSP